MKTTVTMFAITAVLVSLSYSFVAASGDDEVMDKGRYRSSSVSRPRAPRSQFRAPARRVRTPAFNTLRTGGSAHNRLRSEHPTGGYNHNLRIDRNTGRVTNSPSGQLNRMPNGLRPGDFNSPLYGDVAIWSAGRGLTHMRTTPDLTNSTSRPSGRRDNIGSTRLVHPNPFPGQSVEPQFGPNESIGSSRLRPAASSLHQPDGRSLHRPNPNAFHHPSSIQDLDRVMHRPRTNTDQARTTSTTMPVRSDAAASQSQQARTAQGLSEDDHHLAEESGLALAVRAAEVLAEGTRAGQIATTSIGMAPTAFHAGQEIGRAVTSRSTDEDAGIHAGRAFIDFAALGLHGLAYGTGQPEMALGVPVFQRAGYDVVNSSARAGTRAAEIFNVYDFMNGLRNKTVSKPHVPGEIGSEIR